MRRQQQEQLLKGQLDKKSKTDSNDFLRQTNSLVPNTNSQSLPNSKCTTRPRRRGRISTQQKLLMQKQQISIRLTKKRSGRPRSNANNQATESSTASSSSLLGGNQSKRYLINQVNFNTYVNELFENNSKQQIEQIFSVNGLFHSPSSLLTKMDLKSLFQPSLFEALSRQSQLKLIKLLPECDRRLDSHGSFK